MRRQGKAGVASIVIARREHLAAVLTKGPVLMLELLRFAHELRDTSQMRLPQPAKTHFSEGELKMAERLIGDLAGPWRPEQYKDRYHDQLLEVIQRKIRGGAVKVAPAVPTPRRMPADIMALLKESVERAENAGRKHGRGRGT
jgi:DNA end-binding protein Ku